MKKILWSIFSCFISSELGILLTSLAFTYIWRWKLSIWVNLSFWMSALRYTIWLVDIAPIFMSFFLITSCEIVRHTLDIIIHLSRLKYFLTLIGMLLILIWFGWECLVVFGWYTTYSYVYYWCQYCWRMSSFEQTWNNK